jgi:ubiquinone biosynthesis protein
MEQHQLYAFIDLPTPPADLLQGIDLQKKPEMPVEEKKMELGIFVHRRLKNWKDHNYAAAANIRTKNDQFKKCRDQVPAEPFVTVRQTVEQDLGARLEDVFEWFDERELAAASIAQVHAARLLTGEDVVVKVQRPRVASLVRKDLTVMAWIAPYLVGRIPIAALANPPALVELFAETIVEELDFRLEAANMLDVAAMLHDLGQKGYVVPRPHPQLVTRRVLVMERVSGFNFDDVAGMKDAGIDTEAVIRTGMIAFMEGAMIHGIFHGDLHGGNLFVLKDGRTALLDFGIVARLSDERRLAFLRLMLSATTNDVKGQMAA